jgi:FtsZ-binding cell division protein ZapB
MPTEMIVKRLQIIQDLQEELNKIKSHYDEALESDQQFQELEAETEKVKEEKRVKQEKILANPSYKNLSDQLKEKRQELKEHKEALSQELVDYYRENGTIEIEDAEGNIKKMKFSVRLVS